MRRSRFKYMICFLLLIGACHQSEEALPMVTTMPDLMEIPSGFPAIEFPDDNSFTKARWDLGKKLFFDPVMSIDSSLSCASCHQPNLAFSDDQAFSIGVDEQLGTRNSPSLANVAYHPYFTREGGVATLEMQVLVPIQEHDEFNFNIVLIAERLAQDSVYIELSKAAYDRPPDHFVITRAIACFERSLLSGFSRYDQFENGTFPEILNTQEQNGKALFFSERTKCAHCHGGFNFTNYAFENNGLYQSYPDPGRFRLTNEASDRALFKVPSLRNIELTAPYMHDGSINSLEEVIDHYQTGGELHPNKSALIQPLDLNDQEKAALVAFLKTLTDAHFINNPLFKF